MRARWPILAALVSVGAAYVVYPYVTMFQIEAAVRRGDPVQLSRLVDWPAVREGIKEDICDLVLEEPHGPAQAGKLPPFGAGFVHGVTGTAVDRAITAESLVAVTRPSPASPEALVPSQGDTRVSWAFFSGFTRFTVRVSTQDQTEPIKVLMELRGARWRVMRVWIPSDLLGRSGLRA